MRVSAPFQPADLAALDERLFSAAAAVVPMREVFEGNHHPSVIGLRHDVDNSLQAAVWFAEWEASRGHRATYFILHTAPYWQDENVLRTSLERIAELGHEIGIHNNAVVTYLRTGAPPGDVLLGATERLRRWGFDVTGTVAHGDPGCYGRNGQVQLVNDEMFAECVRPTAAPGWFNFTPIPLAALGLDYDANWLPRAKYLSDSGGQWSAPGFDAVAAGFPFEGQLHCLVHACWWLEAFPRVEAAV